MLDKRASMGTFSDDTELNTMTRVLEDGANTLLVWPAKAWKKAMD